MTKAIGELGYIKTTVADVITAAGVSRKAFYEHFTNKEECFLETYDTIISGGARRVVDAYLKAKPPSDALELGMKSIFEQAIEDPHAACLVLVEVRAVGPAGIKRRQQLVTDYERPLLEALKRPSSSGAILDPLLRAILGGVGGILYDRVKNGHQKQLRKLVPELMQWINSYRLSSITNTRLPEHCTPTDLYGLVGGRAPGTLAQGPSLNKARGLRGEHIGSHSFLVHSQRERILDAIARLSASDGYATLKVRKIAEEASVSLDAFYEHFIDKEDAFLVAYEIGHNKCLSLVEHAHSSARTWRDGVRAGIASLFNFLASEPAFARLALVEAPTATANAAHRASKGASAYTRMLTAGLQEASARGKPTALTIEAITAGILELCLSCVLLDRIEELPRLIPHASYFALNPFIGAKRAEAIAIKPS